MLHQWLDCVEVVIDTCWANSTMTALALSSNSSLVFFFCFFSVATTSVSGLFFQSYRRSICQQTTKQSSENNKKQQNGWDTPDDRKQTDLVEGDDEGTLLLLQKVDGLECLRFQAVHDIHHQDGNVAQRAASVPQVTEETNRQTSLCCLQVQFQLWGPVLKWFLVRQSFNTMTPLTLLF